MITLDFISVDIDTGDFDNGTGAAPEIMTLSTQLLIDLIFKDEFE